MFPLFSVFFPDRFSFAAISPSFLIFPDTFISSDVSTVPAFSSFPETVIFLLDFTVPEVTISSLEIVPAATTSPVFLTFLTLIFSAALIFPSFFRSSTVIFFETISPVETVFLPFKSPLVTILPEFLISPETFMFFEVSTVPSFSSFPLIDKSSFVLRLPDDFKLSVEILPDDEISPVFFMSFVNKSPFILILPSLVRLSVFKFFATIVPDVIVFLAVKSSFVKISPVLSMSPEIEIFLTEVNVPVLSNLPLIFVIPVT